jgi:hypothetical protein
MSETIEMLEDRFKGNVGGEECWKTWENTLGKPRNQCCCNCKNLLSLRSHPWVDGKPCSNKLGYVCLAFADDDQVIISNEHGMCELWTQKTQNPI